MPGSSPLTRGARSRSTALRARPGIIPAHAGSTVQHSFRGVLLRDHPRSRGEHSLGVNCERSAAGSSPLTRGARFHSLYVSRPIGIIPAHAGSTHQTRRHRRGPTDHPRSRGEHTHVFAWREFLGGSSPLTRGALIRARSPSNRHRIIPAHAGSTGSHFSTIRMWRDHPRSRGEHPR